MKIVFDEAKKEGVLLKNDGTEVSRYPYKNILSEEFTFEDLKADIEEFNKTLGQQEEFDNIKELASCIKVHSW